jgi:O-antigen/teichoic acid export membrane protein
MVLPIFGIVFTPEVARTLLVPISLLAFGFYLNGTLQIPTMVILATGRLDIALRWALVALVAIMPLTAVLVWTLGLTGAGLSWVLFQIASMAYTIPLFCRSCLGISPRAWYAHAVRPIALFLGAYGGAWMVLGVFGERTPGGLVLGYLAGTAVFMAAATALVGGELRDVARRILAREGSGGDASASGPEAAQSP